MRREELESELEEIALDVQDLEDSIGINQTEIDNLKIEIYDWEDQLYNLRCREEEIEAELEELDD